MRVHDNGALGHLHFGAALAPDRSRCRPVEPDGFAGFSNRVGDPVALEYPTTGSGDYRIPALTVEHADGSTVLDLAYVEHRIVPGKPGTTRTAACPATYVEDDAEADTLEIVLVDGPSAASRSSSRYTIFARSTGRRPQRPDPQRRGRRDPPDGRDERVARPARRATGSSSS